MIELYLVRHAETADNVQRILTGATGDPPLTMHGVRQAFELKARLEGIIFDAVFSSPAQRAQKTAEYAGFAPDVLHVDVRLGEKSFGIFEGRPISEYEAAITDLSNQELYRYRPPKGESFQDLVERVIELERHFATLMANRILVFSHECLNRCLFARLVGLDFERWLEIAQPNADLKRIIIPRQPAN